MIKACDSLQEGRGFESSSRPSAYIQVGNAYKNPCLSLLRSGRSVHVQLGTSYGNMHVTRQIVSAYCNQSAVQAFKQMYSFTNIQIEPLLDEK